MKNKILKVITIMVMALLLTACSASDKPAESTDKTADESSDTKQSQDKSTDKEENVQNSYTIDQVTITAEHYSVEPYNDPNGEYTKQISIMFNIKNETDSAFGYIKSWEGRLPDGFKLESLTETQDLDLIQVPSGDSIDDVAYLLADDSANLDEIIATYLFMDYNEDYWKDFGKIVSGEINEEEFKSKYGTPKELTFDLTPTN